MRENAGYHRLEAPAGAPLRERAQHPGPAGEGIAAKAAIVRIKAADRRSEEERAPALSELQRRAVDRRGTGLVGLLDGTVAALDDTTLEQLWRINVGSGFTAPTMTFEVNGKQYVAIAPGPSSAGRSRLVNTPEFKDQRHSCRVH
jgi:hypothetical protein